MVHSVAIHGQPAIVASLSPRTRARKTAFCQPPVHQSGNGLPAASQKRATSERFASAATQMRRSISADSGKRVNVLLVPAAIAASQSCTHFPVEVFQTLPFSSAALTPRYLFNHTSAGAERNCSNSLTLKVGMTGGLNGKRNRIRPPGQRDRAEHRRRFVRIRFVVTTAHRFSLNHVLHGASDESAFAAESSPVASANGYASPDNVV